MRAPGERPAGLVRRRALPAGRRHAAAPRYLGAEGAEGWLSQASALVPRSIRIRVRPGGVTIELPPPLRGEYFRVDFTYPADADNARIRPAIREPTLDFGSYRDRFAKSPPAVEKPPYTRDRGGYVGRGDIIEPARQKFEEALAMLRPATANGIFDALCTSSNIPTTPSTGVG